MNKVLATIIAICLLYLCAIETVQVVALIKATDYAKAELSNNND